MPKSAIQQDVPADEPAAAAATKQDPAADAVSKQTQREQALAALEARHQQTLAADNGWELAADEEAPAPAEAVPAEPPAEQLEAQLADPAPAALPATIKIKVDGVEDEVPLDEVVRQYQKNASADQRLKEATRLLREAQEAEAARLLRVQQEQQLAAQQQQAAPAAEPNPAAGADVSAAGKDFLKALFEGDEENALAVWNQVMAGRQPAAPASPTLDIDQITHAVTQQVQQKLVVESALDKNRRDYPQLYADPDMEALAIAKIQRKRQDEGIDFFSALEAVSKDMATKFGWTTAPGDEGRPADPAPTTSSRAAKLEQKRTIDNVTSINTKTASTEPQPEDPSAIIAAMKAARAGG